MTHPIVPVANLQRRLPTAGRIRTGIRGPKGAPKAISTFRFTSSDEEAIRQIAAVYGGEARPWKDAPTPGQWEVITTASEIRVVLPPDPLGGTPLYEMWSGGGCQRRCDGVTCSVMQSGPDGGEMVDTDCICSGKGAMECSPHTRLSVILPEVLFAGVWRYESAKSWAVAQEMPGMVDLIQSLQDRGLTRGLLAIEARKTVSAGQTHRFTIPVLRVADTFDQVLAGAARVGQIEAPDEAPALNAASAPEPAAEQDDVADGEIMAEDGDVEDLCNRLAALPTRLRNRAEKLRHHAGLPTLDKDLTTEHAERWQDLLAGVEQAVHVVAPETGEMVPVERPPDGPPLRREDLTPVPIPEGDEPF
jgi:hypothetical protein